MTLRKNTLGARALILAFFISAGLLTACGHSNSTTNISSSLSADSKGSTPTTGGGTGDGGGGQVINCPGQALMLRDLYEIKFGYDAKIKDLQSGSGVEKEPMVSPAAVQLLLGAIENHFGVASTYLEFGSSEFWQNFLKKVVFLTPGTFLKVSQDASSPLDLPTQCRIEQIAYWQDAAGPDNQGVLYVNRSLWEDLDQVNRVALLAHEYFYKQARMAGFSNSDFVRNKVGLLLSQKGLDSIFENWKGQSNSKPGLLLPANGRGFKACTGTTDEDMTAQLQFFQYADASGAQYFVLPWVKSAKVNSSSLTAETFQWSPSLTAQISDENLSRLVSATDFMMIGSSYPKEGKSFPFLLSSQDILDMVGRDYLSPRMRMASQREEFYQQMILELAGNTSANEELWRGVLENGSAANQIQISILNPMTSQIENKIDQLISPAAFKKAVQEVIEEQIKILQNGEEDERNIHSALQVLQAEVKSEFQKNARTSNFPHWQAALKNLGLVLDPDRVGKWFMAPDQAVISTLPQMLLSLEVGSLDMRSATLTLNELKKTYTLFPGRIRVSNEKGSLTFNLRCQDVNGVYKRLIGFDGKNLAVGAGGGDNQTPTKASEAPLWVEADRNHFFNKVDWESFKTESRRLIHQLGVQEDSESLSESGHRYCAGPLGEFFNLSYLSVMVPLEAGQYRFDCQDYFALKARIKNAERAISIPCSSRMDGQVARLELQGQAKFDNNNCMIIRFDDDTEKFFTIFSFAQDTQRAQVDYVRTIQ